MSILILPYVKRIEVDRLKWKIKMRATLHLIIFCFVISILRVYLLLGWRSQARLQPFAGRSLPFIELDYRHPGWYNFPFIASFFTFPLHSQSHKQQQHVNEQVGGGRKAVSIRAQPGRRFRIHAYLDWKQTTVYERIRAENIIRPNSRWKQYSRAYCETEPTEWRYLKSV